MKKRPVAHPAELPIIQPPLEIIKECHICEDKWYILMLSGGYGLTRQHLSVSRLGIGSYLQALMSHFSTCRTC